MLLVLNTAEVKAIVESIINSNLPTNLLYYFFYISIIAFGIVAGYAIVTEKNFQRIIFEELLYLIVIAVIFKVSSLIWKFNK